MQERSTSSKEHAANSIKAHMRGLHDRAIYHAAAEHQPLFKLSVRVSDEHGEPIFFKLDEGRGFGKDLTLKVVSGTEYMMEFELDDLGRTVGGITSVSIDGGVMSIAEQSTRYNERSNNAIFVVRGSWTPLAEKTAKGDRDVVLVELAYQHQGAAHTLEFHLQMKIYATERETMGGYSRRLKAAQCRYDQAKGVERWTFLEDHERTAERPAASDSSCSVQ